MGIDIHLLFRICISPHIILIHNKIFYVCYYADKKVFYNLTIRLLTKFLHNSEWYNDAFNLLWFWFTSVSQSYFINIFSLSYDVSKSCYLFFFIDKRYKMM